MSTGADINGSWNRGRLQYFYDGSYGYGTSGPDNNGNRIFDNTYIPLDDQANGWAITRHSYNYDSLNRLASVTEYFISNTQPESQQFVRTYGYDRWGNRNSSPAPTFEIDTTRNRSYSPGDIALPDNQRRITYDKAGNQTRDTYTGYGIATYDGDNHIVAIQDKFAGTSSYTYNANAHRVRRNTSGQETWQIYGMDGELVAEYAANAAVGSPQKEYGYLEGQLLITGEPVGSKVNWLVSDHLNTPRIVIDKTGTRANVKRHDYLPFGEELLAGTGGRTPALGYVSGDGVRQQFTSKERDNETGLDYFLARYYSSTQGRFTSPDEFQGGPDELYDFAVNASANPTFYADLANPQSLNKYQYTYNNPTNLGDPDGHCPPCLAAAAVVVLIATSADTTNAPGPNDPKYRSGDGVKMMMTAATISAVGGPILDKAIRPIGRFVASKLSGGGGAATEVPTAAASRATLDEATQLANKLQKLPASVRPNAAGAAQATTGEMVTATSARGAQPTLHPAIQKLLDKVPALSRGAAHGRCCEPQLASKLLEAGANPRGATFSVVRIRPPGNPAQGTPISPCETCRILLDLINKK